MAGSVGAGKLLERGRGLAVAGGDEEVDHGNLDEWVLLAAEGSEDAGADELGFLSNPKYIAAAARTGAMAVVV